MKGRAAYAFEVDEIFLLYFRLSDTSYFGSRENPLTFSTGDSESNHCATANFFPYMVGSIFDG